MGAFHGNIYAWGKAMTPHQMLPTLIVLLGVAMAVLFAVMGWAP